MSGPKTHPSLYLEKLGLATAVKIAFFPRFIFRSPKCKTVYFFSSTRFGRMLRKAIGFITGISCRQFQYSLSDIKDDKGTTIAWRIHYQDMPRVLETMISTQKYKSEAGNHRNGDPFGSFLKKNMATGPGTGDRYEQSSTWHVLVMIHVVASCRFSDTESDFFTPIYRKTSGDK